MCFNEGPKWGGGGVCVRFYEENKAHLRFTKIIDSHLWFTKIIRKYIGISWFYLENKEVAVESMEFHGNLRDVDRKQYVVLII